MLFVPCGDLRKDYGAYCETLRLTEREEVYRALHTTAEREHPHTDASSTGDHAANAAESSLRDDAARAAQLLGQPADAIGGAAPVAEERAPKARKASAAGGRKAAGAKATEAAPVDAGAAAAIAAAEALQKRPTLTYISMRHPTFCINQRDITPLCRAMPHCPSLMSVQLVGCGLSQEAYMLLVEAVYKSRRVASVEVDFNAFPKTGFIADPTVVGTPAAAVQPRTSLSSPSATAPVDQPTAIPPLDETPRRSLSAGSASGQRRGSRRASARSKRSISNGSSRVSRGVSDAGAAAAATEAAAAALAAIDEPGAIYLKPTEFCGLHMMPTPLEEQVSEEKDKKGKVDPKKVAQLQAQLEAMRDFDQAHRMKVPSGWHGLLYTGLRHLSLRGNGIGDDAVGEMVEAIQSNPYSHLTTLNLWGNAITDVGAAHLARLLHTNQTLRGLDLGRNHIGDTGVLCLVDCFRVRELATAEELAKYRYAVLTRPSASVEERQAAALDVSAFASSLQPASQPQQSAPPGGGQTVAWSAAVYPSYQDIYRVWHATRVPASTGADGSVNATTTSVATDTATVAATVSSTGTGSGRRGGGTSKGRTAKSEPPPPPTALNRPTTPFDRDCLRLLPTADSPVRVPGNTVMEVLNLGENADVTPNGVREAARRLALHEPHTDEDMLAMVSSQVTMSDVQQQLDGAPLALGACAPLHAVVEPPEPHCAGLRLRSLVVFAKRYADGEALWEEMTAAQRAVNAALDTWAPCMVPQPKPQSTEGGKLDASATSDEARRQSTPSTPSQGHPASRTAQRGASKGGKGGKGG